MIFLPYFGWSRLISRFFCPGSSFQGCSYSAVFGRQECIFLSSRRQVCVPPPRMEVKSSSKAGAEQAVWQPIITYWGFLSLGFLSCDENPLQTQHPLWLRGIRRGSNANVGGRSSPLLWPRGSWCLRASVELWKACFAVCMAGKNLMPSQF